MRRTLPIASTTSSRRRAVGALAATLLAGGLLVGCATEDDAVTDVPTTERTVGPDEEDEAVPDDDVAQDAEGELPSWAPAIETDADGDVTGLDFTGVDPASDELLIEQVTTGDGPAVEAGQTITADYFGQLADADAPFDESFSGEPFMAPIGVGRLIAGWDQALVGVPVGSRVIMSIPPDLGYGENGSPPAIPGGATLFFVIDIIEAQ